MKAIRRLAVAATLAVTGSAHAETVLRVGHFPNITHAQALVAHNLSRQGKGWFEERLGGAKIEWFVYNAGPSAMEAVFALSIDLTYVGPGPALNAYTKSNGTEVRLIAGSANGGAALVVQPDQNLKAPADFRGKKIATPQLGNTQDISCRAWCSCREDDGIDRPAQVDQSHSACLTAFSGQWDETRLGLCLALAHGR